MEVKDMNLDQDATKIIEGKVLSMDNVEQIRNEFEEPDAAKEMNDRVHILIESLKNRAEELLLWQNQIKEEKKKTEDLSRKIGEQSKIISEVELLRKELLQKEEHLKYREVEINKQEENLHTSYNNRWKKLEEEYSLRKNEQSRQQQALDDQKLLLTKKEAQIKEQENALDSDLARKEVELKQALIDKQTKDIEDFRARTSQIEIEWTNNLKKQLTNHEKMLSKMREEMRKEAETTLAKEREAALIDIEKELAAKKKELESLQAAQEIEMNKIKIERQKLAQEIDIIKVQKTRIEQKSAAIDKIIEDTKSSEIEILRKQVQEKQHANELLLARLKEKNEQINQFEQVRADWGDNPPEVMESIIHSLKLQNKEMMEELKNRPNDFDRIQMEDLKSKNKVLLDTIDKIRKDKNRLESSQAEIEDTQMKIDRLDRKVQSLKESNEDLLHDNTLLRNEIKRLKSDDGRAAERDERVKSIEKHLDTVNAPNILLEENPEELNEMNWLKEIGNNCYEYGFKFPNRILYAFHTALKIADWSTITVLAGVSGTGKSELPHLYARFGGLNFISVPVQPNWDSQESMLGFFNSIDNKFDAQPLLRFLAQCSSSQNNMDRSLNIVLLDEMNLAHVEHYFAEFLSKLELRRDYGDEKVPNIDINIGAGMEPYELALTRNILWTGTMNQDETTKSLSDKVLDRGIIIHFPRPKKLIGRHDKKNLDEFIKSKQIRMLDYRIWHDQWIQEPHFVGDQRMELKEYKDIIEEINHKLAKVGRALGHRVWQSIEYYIANYPSVIEKQKECAEGELTDELKKEMRIAFEDQLVQKVMPKLRGIETTGSSMEDCLIPIQKLLAEFSIVDDFRQACRYGYGQFIWNSADYISDEDIAGTKDDQESITHEDDKI